MLDRNVIDQQPDRVRASLQARKASPEVLALVDRFAEVLGKRRELQAVGDALRADRNRMSNDIGTLMRQGDRDEANAQRARVKGVGDRIDALDAEQKALQAEEDHILMQLPNLLDARVPTGASEHDNQVLAQWGTPRTFDFQVLDHVDLGEKLGLLDLGRAARLSGARFPCYKGGLARLERALVSFFLDRATLDLGYTEVLVPYIVSRTTMTGTGQLPKFEADLFRLAGQLNGEDAFLIPTAEVPVTNLHRDELLQEEQLPIRYCSFTPCFRAEAGSHGRDTRGLMRQHQFHKVELVKLCTAEQGQAEHEALTEDAEALLQALELPYRKVVLCSADLSANAAITYDLEVWVPSQGTYREISSCSWFGDFQGRRMGTRYRPAEGGKPRTVHTINGSGLAVGRTLIAIMENHQQADGSITVPEVLRPYMGGLATIGRSE